MSREFSRQAVMRIADISSSNLSYMDRTGLVVPRKEGNPKKPKVTYSEEQLVRVVIISRLRKQLPLQTIRVVMDELKKREYKPDLFESRLLVVGKDVLWIEKEDDLSKFLVQLTGKHRGQVVLYFVDPIGNVYEYLSREDESKDISYTTLKEVVSV